MSKEEKYQKDKIIHSKSELVSVQNELITNSKNLSRIEYDKNVKPKKKQLTTKLAVGLVYAYKYYLYSGAKTTDYFKKKDLLIHLKEYPRITRTFHHLKYWGLICQMPTSPEKVIYKKGYYGITDMTREFIQKEIALPKFAYVVDDVAVGHKAIPVMITDLIPADDLVELLKP